MELPANTISYPRVRFISSFVVFAVLIFFLYTNFANASSGFNFDVTLEGYAWSSTIGWISLNCSNTGTCGTSNYGVVIQPSGELRGYAWSSNIGWIKFHGLSAYPSATGNSGNAAARVTGTFPNWRLTGWARACAGTAPGDCSSMTNYPGGWDGWISLEGSNHSVRLDSSNFVTNDSFAWGSSVMGWISFPSAALVAPAPTIVLTPTSNPVSYGDPISLNYVTTGGYTCTASNDGGDTTWSGLITTLPSGTVSLAPDIGDTVYTLTCDNGLGDVTTESVTVNARENIRINAFSVSTPSSPDANGLYSNVSLLSAVQGLAPGNTAPYRAELNSPANSYALTGTVDHNGNFSPSLNFTNVNFGNYNATLDIDLPAPGSILEDLASTPVDEDVAGNSAVVNNSSFSPPPVQITIDPSEGDTITAPTPSNGILGRILSRPNSSQQLTFTFEAPYAAECTIRTPNGANDQSVTLSGAGTVKTASVTFSTQPLRNEVSHFVECIFLNNPIFPTFSGQTMNENEYILEVLPTVEEI